MDILNWTSLVKYLLFGLGAVGLLIMIIGLFKSQRELLYRGGCVLIAAIVLFICGYFVLKTTLERASTYTQNPYTDEQQSEDAEESFSEKGPGYYNYR